MTTELKSNNPKIIFALADKLGCGFYRGEVPYQALSKLGFDVLFTNSLDVKETKKADALVLQRQHSDGVLAQAQLYREQSDGGKLVFELDDDLFSIPHSNPSSRVYRNGLPALRNVEKLIRSVDLMTVSTETLKSEYSRFNKNIFVCPNALPEDAIYEVSSVEQGLHNPDVFRLGWAGSGTHRDDIAKIIKPVVKIMDEFQHVRFVFIGENMKKMFPVHLWARIDHIGHTFPVDANGNPLSYDPNGNPTVAYYKLLKQANLDAAIAPIESYLFNHAKSEIKCIEYGLTQIPFVASRFGPYRDYVGPFSWSNIEHEVGILAETDREWYRAIKELILKPDLRKTLAANNYANVIAHHTIKSKIDKWVSALASIGLHPGSQVGTYQEKIVNTNAHSQLRSA